MQTCDDYVLCTYLLRRILVLSISCFLFWLIAARTLRDNILVCLLTYIFECHRVLWSWIMWMIITFTRENYVMTQPEGILGILNMIALLYRKFDFVDGKLLVSFSNPTKYPNDHFSQSSQSQHLAWWQSDTP